MVVIIRTLRNLGSNWARNCYETSAGPRLET